MRDKSRQAVHVRLPLSAGKPEEQPLASSDSLPALTMRKSHLPLLSKKDPHQSLRRPALSRSAVSTPGTNLGLYTDVQLWQNSQISCMQTRVESAHSSTDSVNSINNTTMYSFVSVPCGAHSLDECCISSGPVQRPVSPCMTPAAETNVKACHVLPFFAMLIRAPSECSQERRFVTRSFQPSRDRLPCNAHATVAIPSYGKQTNSTVPQTPGKAQPCKF